MALSTRMHQDELGVLIVLDDLLKQKPLPDGAAKAIAALPLPEHIDGDRLNDRNGPSKQDYFSALQETLTRYGLHPFVGPSVAVIGFYDMHHNKSTLRWMGPLLREANITDISKETKGPLTTASVARIAGGRKFDYVVTGNVINAPDGYKKTPDGYEHHSKGGHTQNYDTILAVASLIKAGGKAVHMLFYGGDYQRDLRCRFADDPGLQRYAGQRHLRNYPEGPYCFSVDHVGFRRKQGPMLTRAMVLVQEREVDHTPETAKLYLEKMLDARKYVEQSGDKRIQTREGDAGFTWREAYDYLSQDPQHIRRLGTFDFFTLTLGYCPKIDARDAVIREMAHGMGKLPRTQVTGARAHLGSQPAASRGASAAL